MAHCVRPFSWTLILALAADIASARQGLDIPDPASSFDGAPTADPAAPAEAESIVDLEIVWIDVLGDPAYSFRRAMGEASEILGEVGLRYRYRLGDVAAVSGPNELRIIVLQRSQAPPIPGRLVMGAVNARFAKPGEARAIWIYTDAVVSALGLASAEQDPMAVAIAMGRVVAHEIIHVMAPQVGHAKSGLMSAVLSAKDLRGARVSISGAFRDALAPTGSRGDDRRVGSLRPVAVRSNKNKN